ncbi:hypothetical protein GGTG_14023 [Gaeumannomyces tritici R3-111a-1]|uniref:Uncharacterized protein n=1 Tax=Gaeumannomyces tritici (strain R3-111a-1) TaxID=644352 RepID=J3PKG7_GAET3|nr:hypothetical protein GGTG_14023 [Gaeumannomyces tritici R3-111a-1]EJT68404.1 hypothetical protein GGTG_14023 [Gaeumannomyces tritici R3-111a-1]
MAEAFDLDSYRCTSLPPKVWKVWHLNSQFAWDPDSRAFMAADKTCQIRSESSMRRAIDPKKLDATVYVFDAGFLVAKLGISHRYAEDGLIILHGIPGDAIHYEPALDVPTESGTTRAGYPIPLLSPPASNTEVSEEEESGEEEDGGSDDNYLLKITYQQTSYVFKARLLTSALGITAEAAPDEYLVLGCIPNRAIVRARTLRNIKAQEPGVQIITILSSSAALENAGAATTRIPDWSSFTGLSGTGLQAGGRGPGRVEPDPEPHRQVGNARDDEPDGSPQHDQLRSSRLMLESPLQGANVDLISSCVIWLEWAALIKGGEVQIL